MSKKPKPRFVIIDSKGHYNPVFRDVKSGRSIVFKEKETAVGMLNLLRARDERVMKDPDRFQIKVLTLVDEIYRTLSSDVI